MSPTAKVSQQYITPIGENSENKVYYDVCETTFKLRYANHKERKRSANITWEILGRHQAYNTSSKRCSLCLNEKLKIALHGNNNMLNRQTEILSKCRYKNKYALSILYLYLSIYLYLPICLSIYLDRLNVYIV